jgi:hypothetical protein
MSFTCTHTLQMDTISLHFIFIYPRFSYFFYSVKNRHKRKRKCPFIESPQFRWCILRLLLRLFTLPPFVPFLQYCLRHDVYSVCSVLSLSLSLWYSPLLTTIRYARIIISTFYTHTRFSSSHLTTRLPVHSLLSLFFFFLKRKRKSMY